jgi:hypothetical protein
MAAEWRPVASPREPLTLDLQHLCASPDGKEVAKRVDGSVCFIKPITLVILL